MGLLAGETLGLTLPQPHKRLLAILETDGCAADGVAVATNCWVGRRTMRIEDYGKVAATFVDTESGQALRIVPRGDIRAKAWRYAPEALNHKWQAQLLGYQRMPAAELLAIQPVSLRVPVAQWVGQPGQKVACDYCGEEIMNGRQVRRAGLALCRACAGQSYYSLFLDTQPRPVPMTPASRPAVVER